MHSGYKSFTGYIYIFCKYFLSVWSLFFYLLECFKEQKFLTMTSSLVFTFTACTCDVISNKSLPNSTVLYWRQSRPYGTCGHAWRCILMSQLGKEGSPAGRGQVKELVTQSSSNYLRPHRQEYWSGSPFPSPGDLPHPGIKQLVMFSLLFLFVFPLIVFFCIIFKHFSVFHFNLSIVFCYISLHSFLVVSLGTTIHILNLSESA